MPYKIALSALVRKGARILWVLVISIFFFFLVPMHSELLLLLFLSFFSFVAPTLSDFIPSGAASHSRAEL